MLDAVLVASTPVVAGTRKKLSGSDGPQDYLVVLSTERPTVALNSSSKEDYLLIVRFRNKEKIRCLPKAF